jgi:hypothetical protein
MRSHLLVNFALHHRYRLIVMDRLLLQTGYVNGRNLATGTQADVDRQGEYVAQSPLSFAS